MMDYEEMEGGLNSVIVENVVAPEGAPLLFPLKAHREASRLPPGLAGRMTRSAGRLERLTLENELNRSIL